MAGLFGGNSNSGAVLPSAPIPQAVVRMPDRQDPAALEASRRKRAELTSRSRGGRSATDLSSDSYGTIAPYSNDDLGK